MRRALFPILLTLSCGPKVAIESDVGEAVSECRASWRFEPARFAATPAPLGELMGEGYEPVLLLSAQVASDGPAWLFVGSADETGAQDRCAETSSLSFTVGEGGAFSLDGATVAFSAADTPGALYAASLSGEMDACAGALSIDRIDGVMDTRHYVSLIGSSDDEALCSMLKIMGPCAPCPADSAERCWSVGFAGVTAEPTDAVVEPRTRADICADPACADATICQ